MQNYRVIDKNGRTLLNSTSKSQCDLCASHHRDSRVFAVNKAAKNTVTKNPPIARNSPATLKNKLRLKRNPEGYFEEEEDTYETRISRFSQYQSTDSEVWMRETIQNAVDNKGTDIKISVLNITSGTNKGCYLVRITDNGTGMTSEVLRNKFLKMKGSDKREDRGQAIESSTVGGFGEAKKVILLAWKAWRVITKHKDYKTATIAESLKGGRPYFYDQIECPPEIPESGTIVEILTWANSTHTVYLPDAINFIARCNLPKVLFSFVDGRYTSGGYCNSFARSTNHDAVMQGIFSTNRFNPVLGIDVETHHINKTAGFKLGNARETITATVGDPDNGVPMVSKECCKIYAAKSENSYGYIYFRSKGLLMWSEYLSTTPINVIVEFTVNSTLILSDNRDGIKHKKLKEAITAWLTKLLKDPSHAMRGFSKTRTVHCKGTLGAMSAPIKPKAQQAVAEIMAIESGGISNPAKKTEAIETVVDDMVELIVKVNDRAAPESPVRICSEVAREMIKYELRSGIKKQYVPGALQDAIERIVVIPEYLCHIEEDLYNKEFKIPKKFEADSLTADIKKLLAVWVEMIRVVFMLKGSKKRFGVGFVFSEEALGVFVPVGMIPEGVLRDSDADGFILINPYYRNLTERQSVLDVSNPNELKSMWSTAVHECTHMIDGAGQHDTTFASMLTMNIGITAGIYGLVQEISKIVTTTDALEKSKFSSTLDIDSYLDESVKKPKSAKEKNLEKYVAELARELVNSGIKLPEPDEYGVTLPDRFMADIATAKANTARGEQAADAMSKTIIKSLRNKLAATEAKIDELEKRNAIIEPNERIVEDRKPRKLSLDISKLRKKYN